jgi:hypothetical protein
MTNHQSFPADSRREIILDPPPKNSRTLFLALWFTLLLYSAVAAPVPGVNEPHYLGKAKHYWDPAWCAGDLLYDSSNAHAVFYFTMGLWANWLSLPQLAWFGRGVGEALLGWGWLQLHRALGLTGGKAWWSLIVFLALASWGNLSGEWIVGGIEGKVFSYAFLMWAFAAWNAGRVCEAAVWGGVAVSFHPVAGGWGVLAALLAQGWERLRNPKRLSAADVVAGLILVTAAAPGLMPVLPLVFADDPPSVRLTATYVHVYYRLAHHLDPMKFPWYAWCCYAALAAGILLARRTLTPSVAGRRWLGIFFWSGMFAAVGLLAGIGPRPADRMPYYLDRMSLLKFYPFRLFDVLAPLTAAFLTTRLIADGLTRRPAFQRRLFIAICGFTLFAAMVAGEVRRRQREPTVFDAPAWIDVCRWVREHTPTTALVQTPVYNPNFKWYAQRAEYVSYKDVPQDNAGIVEWNRRLLFLRSWYQERFADGVCSNEELRSLRAETGITHIVTDRLGPFEPPPRYTNNLFRVYDLTVLDESDE